MNTSSNQPESEALFERAVKVIPGGVPGIRAPENFVQGSYPIFLESASGAYVKDVDGKQYLDMLMGYGPIVLGHAHSMVDLAVQERQKKGFCLNLPQPEIVELAERLVRLVPSAEQALFFKTGSDATSAAIRVARSFTGRQMVLRCGYHGWHDWCLKGDRGVPTSITDLVVDFHYNAADQVEDLLQRHSGKVAAIIITPVGHDFDRQLEPPAEGFLQTLRALADAHECVLIFDEVRTGFRLALGGAQQLYGVTPDLTALGKAMSNGYPISALVGSAKVMAAAKDTFISSTYFPESLTMAAALAAINILENGNVLQAIDSMGKQLETALGQLIAEIDLPVTLSPYPQLPFLYFDPTLASGQEKRRDRFYGVLSAAGVFAHPRHHGFLSAQHGEQELDRLLDAVRKAAQYALS